MKNPNAQDIKAKPSHILNFIFFFAKMSLFTELFISYYQAVIAFLCLWLHQPFYLLAVTIRMQSGFRKYSKQDYPLKTNEIWEKLPFFVHVTNNSCNKISYECSVIMAIVSKIKVECL